MTELDYKDLNTEEKAEYRQKIKDEYLEPLCEKGIIRRVNHKGEDIYAGSINPKHLMQYIHKASTKKGNPDLITVNNSSVILSFGVVLNMIVLLNEYDEENHKRFQDLIDSYQVN